MGLLATLTRSAGVLLLIPLAYYYYERRGWKLRKTDSHVANLLMVIEGLLVWMTYLALAFGKPLAFSTAQAQWERGVGAPNYTVTKAIVATVYGLRSVVSASTTGSSGRRRRAGPSTARWAPTSSTCWSSSPPRCSCGTGRRTCPGRIPGTPWRALSYPLFFPSKFVPLMSYPRFTLTVFPLYVALALYARDHRGCTRWWWP